MSMDFLHDGIPMPRAKAVVHAHRIRSQHVPPLNRNDYGAVNYGKNCFELLVASQHRQQALDHSPIRS